MLGTFAGSRVVGDGHLVPRRHGAVLSTSLRTVVFDEQPQSVRCRHLACTSVTCDRPSCSIHRILYTSLIDTGTALNPDDTRRLSLRTFVAQLVAATKICPQPRQNAAATTCATNMASSDTDDDVILIAGVLLSGAFLNQCKKKANKRKRSIWSRRWIEQREKHGTYHSLITKQKVNKSTILTNQRSAFSATCCTD